FNTPSEFQFFEKKNGGRNVVFQTAATSQNPISLYSNGFVFRCYIVEPKKEPITAILILRAIGSASSRLAL
ncbi:MAG: hypothetical protein PHS04_15360, partial [Tissierellia bacterium]|nr:hypothetical protein [Tissierellia bacterium]